MIAGMSLLRSPRRSRVVVALATTCCLAVLSACTVVTSGTPERAGNAPGQDPASTSPAETEPGEQPGNQITVPPDSGNPSSSADPDQTPSSSSAAPAADLRKFYQQKLDWGDCAPYAMTPSDGPAYASDRVQCARLTVPLDYAKPDGTTITIGVLRQKSSGDAQGSVVFNPGGPGASGMSVVASIAMYGLDPQLREHFDLVGFDPRGVGASEPAIQCQTDQQRDQARADNWPGFMPTSTDAEIDAANAASKAFVQDCITTMSGQGVDGKEFLAQVGTTNVAKDLDVLRAVLGDDKLTYVGWSYGTSIGTQYAEQFPTKVRAMILDGAVDPAVDAATDNLQQTTAFQKAFDTFAQWCASRSGCPWSNAETATKTFQQMAQPLMDKPLPLPDGRVLSFLDAVIGVADAMYSDYSWPTLLTALADFEDGKGAKLMALADSYNQRDSSGHYTNLLEAFTAIRCMDSNRITDPKKVIELNKKLNAAAPFEDNGEPAAAVFDTCAFWPVPPTMTPHTPDPQGLPPVLVISTTGDPATPYESGVNLAKDLGGALLTVKGTRHTAFMLSGIACADNAGNDYLINLTVPKDGATCG